MGSRSQKNLQHSSALEAIQRHGALLVFPVANREQPHSLWAEFFPGTPMVWAWDEDSDHRVGDMWQMMKQLSDCRDVVYSKWYQGRATFFSHELFTAMLSTGQAHRTTRHQLSETARVLFEILENNSPLSTKQLKELTDLRGKHNEGVYGRGMKELFEKLLIVGFGEVDDGAFPSLAVGATELLFEDLWRESRQLSEPEARRTLDRFMPKNSLLRKQFDKDKR